MSGVNWGGYPWTEAANANRFMVVELNSIPDGWGFVPLPGGRKLYLPAPVLLLGRKERNNNVVYLPVISIDVFPFGWPLLDPGGPIELLYELVNRAPGVTSSIREVTL